MPKKSFKQTEKGHEDDWLEQTIACSSEKFNRIQGDNMTPRDRSINYLFIYFFAITKNHKCCTKYADCSSELLLITSKWPLMMTNFSMVFCL